MGKGVCADFQWAESKDQFKVMRPLTTGVGLRLMQKMGWQPGTGLGKDRMGDLEPLQLDVKFDRKGLAAQDESHKKAQIKAPVAKSGPIAALFSGGPQELGERNPISLLMEFAAKRRMPAPSFTFIEEGLPKDRRFNCSVVVNGVQYTPATLTPNKKLAKTIAAHVALQGLGLIRADPSIQ